MRPGSEHVEWVWLVAKAFSLSVGVQVAYHCPFSQISTFDKYSQQVGDEADLCDLLASIEVPEFTPRAKAVVTDETQQKSDEVDEEESKDGLKGLDQLVSSSKVIASKGLPVEALERLEVLSCHLRCDMYSVPRETDEMVLQALGRIQPCLKATAARVVGLGLGELATALQKGDSGGSKGLPYSWWVGEGIDIRAETQAVSMTKLPSGLNVTLWSKLEVFLQSSCFNYFNQR